MTGGKNWEVRWKGESNFEADMEFGRGFGIFSFGFVIF